MNRPCPRRTSLLSTSLLQKVTIAVLTLMLLALLAAQPASAQKQKVLYSFTGGHDGQSPQSSLTPHGGNFYGTTYSGGLGFGTVFELSPSGGGWTETVLYAFSGGSDGRYPAYMSVIFDGAGNLYGTTVEGGTSNSGVVFELTPNGQSWTASVLYNFCSQAGCADGEYPVSSLIMDAAGNLFGVTDNGVFELSPSGGSWTEQIIYNYGVESENSSGLTKDAAGNIFGIIYVHTFTREYSKVFELSPNGDGWTPTILHKFSGVDANGTLALDQEGSLYGTTGPNNKNNGTIFKLTGTNGRWMKKTLHTFSGGDGNYPWGGIVFDAAGNIFGTTLYGGQYGFGTVFELAAPAHKNKYTEKILWNFNNTNGAVPVDSLFLDNSGTIYGTTTGGGSKGQGVVFQLTQ